jgi:hypothetical protein
MLKTVDFTLYVFTAMGERERTLLLAVENTAVL